MSVKKATRKNGTQATRWGGSAIFPGGLGLFSLQFQQPSLTGQGACYSQGGEGTDKGREERSWAKSAWELESGLAHMGSKRKLCVLFGWNSALWVVHQKMPGPCCFGPVFLISSINEVTRLMPVVLIKTRKLLIPSIFSRPTYSS